MAKSRPSKAKSKTVSGSPERLSDLLQQAQFPAALAELDKIRRGNPEFQPPLPEADIWRSRGHREFGENQWRAAENSFRQAIKLGQGGDCYYWAAKALLRLNRLDSAVALLKEGFEADRLTKDFDLCYPKLLLMGEDGAAVAALMEQYPQRFDADAVYWLQGALALLAGEGEEALARFGEVSRALTPGDHPYIWEIYALQKLGRYEEAARREMTLEPKSRRAPAVYQEHECLQCFALFHWLREGQTPLTDLAVVQNYPLVEELWEALSLLDALQTERYAAAGLHFLQLDNALRRLPELQELRLTLFLLAGQEAVREGEMKSVQGYWMEAWNDKAFNSQLAINLSQVLKINDAWTERQRVLTRLLKWLEEERKSNPQAWPADLLNHILAHLHCSLAHTALELGRRSVVLDEVRRAESLCPQSPEVIGFKGVIADLEYESEKAITLLTSALEAGTENYLFYSYLEGLLEDLGRSEVLSKMRTRFGPRFGEAPTEAPPFEPWELALAGLSYEFLLFTLETEDEFPPPLRVCQLFTEAVEGQPNPDGKVSLNQAKAKKIWDIYLQTLAPTDQALCLEAIGVCLCLFVKREKGLAALIKEYLQQLSQLISQVPSAQISYLALLALKEKKLAKVLSAVKSYLDSQPQRADALARLQLRYRRYAEWRYLSLFLPLLEEARQKEPQNPLLLLALATAYFPSSEGYAQRQQESFELARRLQSAEALLACRQEEYLHRHRRNQDLMLQASRLEEDQPDRMEAFFKEMIFRMLGDEISEEEIERRLPELMEILMEEMSQEEEEEDESETDPPSGRSGFVDPFARGRKKRRR